MPESNLQFHFRVSSYLPLVRAVIDDLGIHVVIEKELPKHSLSLVSDADCAVALILNALSDGAAMYRMDWWLQRMDTHLLYGEGASATSFNDTRLALALDHLDAVGTDNILAKVVGTFLSRLDREKTYSVGCSQADSTVSGGGVVHVFSGRDLVSGDDAGSDTIRLEGSTRDGYLDIRSAGDVDGDGIADLVAAEPGAGEAHGVEQTGLVLLFRGADIGEGGTFSDSVAFATVHGEYYRQNAGAEAVLADFDGDGVLDLVVGTNSAERETESSTSFLLLGPETHPSRCHGEGDGAPGHAPPGRPHFVPFHPLQTPTRLPAAVRSSV